MKLQFLGATQTVTGSKYHLTAGGKSILVDCGLFQGLKELRLRNWAPLPISAKTIDAVVLTHAHLDHSGYLPLLVKQGFKGPIYATEATQELGDIILRDSGRIQEDDARRANKYSYSKHHPALPLYTEEDAIRAIEHFKKIEFGKHYPIGAGLSFNAARAGHILGSSIMTFHSEDKTLVFTGDLGRPKDPIMRRPETIQEADYLVIESTYGNRIHPKEDPIETLGKIIRDTAKRGGSVIIPAFAVGRTQSVLYLLYKLRAAKAIPEIPIYLDSPMAQDATDILRRNNSEHILSLDVCHEVCGIAEYIRTVEASKHIDSMVMPKVIISASGMCEGGRVLHHLAHYGPDEKNTIVFTGFQAKDTRGDRILRGEKEIKIHGHMVPIRAHVESLYSLSSHADYVETLEWLKGFNKPPKKVFITHGEPEAAEALKMHIEETLGWEVVIPRYLEEFIL